MSILSKNSLGNWLRDFIRKIFTDLSQKYIRKPSRYSSKNIFRSLELIWWAFQDFLRSPYEDFSKKFPFFSNKNFIIIKLTHICKNPYSFQKLQKYSQNEVNILKNFWEWLLEFLPELLSVSISARGFHEVFIWVRHDISSKDSPISIQSFSLDSSWSFFQNYPKVIPRIFLSCFSG